MLGMALRGEVFVAQRCKRRIDCVKKPKARYLLSGGSGRLLTESGDTARKSLVLLLENFDKAPRQRHQPGARAHSHARRDEVLVEDVMPQAASEHSRRREQFQAIRFFALNQETNILSAETHWIFVLTGDFVEDRLFFREVANVAVRQRSIQGAIAAGIALRGNSQVGRDRVRGWREQVFKGQGRRRRVRRRNIE